MTQSSDRLDRMERILEQTLEANSQFQRETATAIASQNAAIAQILQIQQSNASTIASHGAVIAQIFAQQQTNTEAIARVNTQIEESSRHLIETIDYAMGRIEEMVQRTLNPSPNGNPPLEF
ncbi:hypothetical protein DSM106972_097420 [Dulcicalothrix desertica PCC 7102]|uniref:Uncharacterized protein n=1 Tax=Dulcicalothrix desertica PCC 7102 TaxID=232991 RepID=A0A3S1BXN0_9CYAN|nr:hypothetical protein [Dulcicalothrix desertica]RUS93110.1 hypothetical protein DSM106972_097420 [Dulcicalothrix desertica PCC 7102]TWH61186.1 hypothetical protein CAL7102_01041 [Dulcicalothrix desertica PCC 7102]